MGQRDLEYMIPELGLRKENLDVVVLEEETPSPQEDNRWMLVVMVHMDREFSNTIGSSAHAIG